jgi:acyl carrier protein
MKSALRRILTESARLDVPADMLAVEDEFNIEIPDRMLTRRLFSSIDSLAAAVTELQLAQAAA